MPPASGLLVFDDDNLVKFFFNDEHRKIYFVIKSLSPKEKQKSKFLYKFIIMEYQNEPSTKVVKCSNNNQVLSLIIKNLACNDEYKRHFNINKILKDNEENRS